MPDNDVLATGGVYSATCRLDVDLGTGRLSLELDCIEDVVVARVTRVSAEVEVSTSHHWLSPTEVPELLVAVANWLSGFAGDHAPGLACRTGQRLPQFSKGQEEGKASSSPRVASRRGYSEFDVKGMNAVGRSI